MDGWLIVYQPVAQIMHLRDYLPAHAVQRASEPHHPGNAAENAGKGAVPACLSVLTVRGPQSWPDADLPLTPLANTQSG
jgi:hypothetical protein